MSSLDALWKLLRTAVGVFWDLLTFFRLTFRTPQAVAAENLFLRKQLALYVDFLHHPTFPPRRKLRGFFCLTRTGRGQLQILSIAQTSSRVVSDSNSGLITNSPCTACKSLLLPPYFLVLIPPHWEERDDCNPNGHNGGGFAAPLADRRHAELPGTASSLKL